MGVWTSNCPICGLHFRIGFESLLEIKIAKKNQDKFMLNFDKLKKLKNLEKSTFSNYNKITLLLEKKVKHNVKYDDNNNFEVDGEVHEVGLTLQRYGPELKGLPMHTECWNLAEKKFNYRLTLEDFVNNKNLSEIDPMTYLFDSLDYGTAEKYFAQDWDVNVLNFVLNQKDWYILYLPSGDSDEAKKNYRRIEKNLAKIVKGSNKNHSPSRL